MKIENYHGDIHDILHALNCERKTEGCSGKDWMILDKKQPFLWLGLRRSRDEVE